MSAWQPEFWPGNSAKRKDKYNLTDGASLEQYVSCSRAIHPNEANVRHTLLYVYLLNAPSWLAYTLWALAAFMTLVILIQGLRVLRKQLLLSRLKRHLAPFFTPAQIKHALDHYVPTRFRYAEAGEQVRENLVKYFVDEVFTKKHFEFNYFMVLSRPGMGKTAFLVNLFWNYRYQLLRKDYRIKLIALNHPGAFQAMERCPHPDQTVLLLDGLDEVAAAISNYKAYMDQLLAHTPKFAKVVISCTSGFLPYEVERPQNSDPISYVGEENYQLFGKIYIDPFDETDTFTYLKKRLSMFEVKQRVKAQALQANKPYIFSCPLFLHYISYLLQRPQQSYEYTYQVYEALLQEWIAYHAQKRHKKDQHYAQKLFRLWVELAWDIYVNWEDREGLWIPTDTLLVYQKNIGVNIEPWAHSPVDLHPNGYFFFTHPSFVGFLVAWRTFHKQEGIPDVHFKGLSMAAICYQEMCWEAYAQSIPQLEGHYRTTFRNEKTPLSDIRPWELRDITRIYLDHYRQADMRFLKGLTYLRGLYLNEAQASDVTPGLVEQLPHPDTYLYLQQGAHIRIMEVTSSPIALEVDGIRGVAYQWDPPQVMDLQSTPDPTQLYRPKVNGHAPSEAILKVFNMDLKSMPNATCKQIGDGSNEQGMSYRIFEQYAGFAELDVFNHMHVHVFPDGSRNVLFHNTYTPTLLVQTLSEMVERFVRVYGEDDFHRREFDEDDEAQVEDGLWLGRTWAWGNTHDYAYPLHLFMDQPGKVQLMVFGIR